jgi:hypothetical protein
MVIHQIASSKIGIASRGGGPSIRPRRQCNDRSSPPAPDKSHRRAAMGRKMRRPRLGYDQKAAAILTGYQEPGATKSNYSDFNSKKMSLDHAWSEGVRSAIER